MLIAVQFRLGAKAGGRPKPVHLHHAALTRRLAALLCVLLVGMATVEAFHVHADEFAKDARPCAVCHVAHAPGQPVSSARIAVSFTPTAFFIPVADPDREQDPDSFPLFSRPPPLV